MNSFHLISIQSFRLVSSLILMLLFTQNLTAQLTQVINRQGKLSLVVDGCGTNNFSCNITIEKPIGATTVNEVWVIVGVKGLGGSDPGSTPVTFNNNITPVLSNLANPSRYGNVTSSFSNLFNNMTAGTTMNISIWESNTSEIEGVGMFVIWDNPSAPETLLSLSLGQTTTSDGIVTTVNTAAPINTSNSDFAVFGGVAINFSTGDASQISNFIVNGTTITNQLGGLDDGQAVADGELWTIGGYGDSPTTGNADELLDLTSAIPNGSTSISFSTSSAHLYDYLNAIYICAEGVPPEEPACSVSNVVPELIINP